MILPVELILLTLVFVFGFCSLYITDLMNAAIVFGAYSFLMCLIWTGMGAVDVAFTEAAVGAGVSTVFLIACIYNTKRTIKYNSWDITLKLFAGIVCTVIGFILISAISDFPAWGDPYSPANNNVARYYVENTIKDTHVPNVVTSVLADYRAFDTMFETAVVFVAGLAIWVLLRRKKRTTTVPYDESSSLIVRIGSKIMVPFMQIFALYVVAHGHYSPGGGFQGGVILGASLILLAMAFNLKEVFKRINEKKIMIYSALGVLIFAGAGAVCMFLGANFLDYSVWSAILPATDTVMARSHLMLIVEIGVALTVMCGMFGIYSTMASNGNMDQGL